MGFALGVIKPVSSFLLINRVRVMVLGDFNIFCSSGVDQIWLLYLSSDDWFSTIENGECNQIKVLFETSSPRLMCENVEFV